MFIFAAALGEGRWFQPRELDQRGEVLRRFDGKIFWKDLEDSKKVLTFAARKEDREVREAGGGSERYSGWKNLEKDLEESEKVFTFAPLSAEKTVDGREVKTDSEPREETGIVLIAI